MWKKAIYIEHEFAKIAEKQERNGWLFDKDRALELIDILDFDMKSLKERIEIDLPDCPMTKTEMKAWTPPVKQFLINGKPSANAEKFFDEIRWQLETSSYIGYKWDEDKQEHCVVPLPYNEPIRTTKPLTLDNNKYIKEYLMDLGWKPTWWNYNNKDEKTSPKTKWQGSVCPNLERMEHPIAKAIVHYMSMRHRKGLLEGLLKVVRPDGRIPSEMVTIGTPTYRVKHRKIANFPNTESYFGKEIRSCFICDEGNVLVSTDSDSCQMRMLAHYLIQVGCPEDDPYIQAILYGTKEEDNDAHCLARDLAGLKTRSQGKKLNYSLLFGQGDASTASTLNLTIPQTKTMKKRFFQNVPALPRLQRELQSAWERKGYFTGLDGRPIYADSDHKLLNYALQSAEAIYMKVANCLVEKTMTVENIIAMQVCFYHDEFTHEVMKHLAKRLAQIHEACMVQAGIYLNLNVPMTGKASIGKSWAEVH